jgi:hypothetical protein
VSDHLAKDESILSLLEAIDLQARGWIIIDHWPADRFAIGIGDQQGDQRLGYISTWRKQPGCYYVELEISASPDSLDYTVEAKADDCDLQHVIAMLERHLTPQQPSKS